MPPSLDLQLALVPVAPFIAAFLAPLIFRFTGHFAGWVLGIVPASIFLFLLGFLDPVAHHRVVVGGLEWIPAYGLDFSFFVDGLSLTFGLLISGIGTIIVVYSGGYLRGHPHQGRFFSFILMFMGSMLGLVLADNLITLFVFWELTSITSFLLIGFDHMRQAARRAAIQALVVTGGGGLVLLAGILVLHQVTISLSGSLGTWALTDILGSGEAIRGHPLYLLVLFLFLGGAFTKSAQFPFHFWLPNAMEAPTPVSAFLHSATMVKAGVYLLARMNPILGGTDIWSVLLVVFGGMTLLWGATLALRQTDLKQMLAQTTVASLGLLVLLIGVGTEVAIAGAVVYLIAHALYKAALFLVAGMLDHETGTREITELGGLRELMPVTFIAAALAGFSMAGLPPAIGFFAKEEMYLALALPYWQNIAVLLVVVVGNAMMLVVGAAVAIKPFLGVQKPTPKSPHEAPLSMYWGPVLLGILALATGFFLHEFGEFFLTPMASSIYNFEVESHLHLGFDLFLNPLILLSFATWALGAFLYWQLDTIRKALRRFEAAVNWNFDKGFDGLVFGLVRLSDRVTRVLHNGQLENYLIVVFLVLAAVLYLPLVLMNAIPGEIGLPQLTFFEWGVIVIALLGLLAVVVARSRLIAIVSLGVQGFAVALIFMLFGAPDLSFTQFMVETLSVVILALVMTRLHLEHRDSRVLEEVIRDGGLALLCGSGVTLLMLSVLQHPLDMSLTDFFAQTSVAVAHGHNIVNVILVDYRGLDTLGEISVVMTAGIAILALIRIRLGGAQKGVGAPKPAKDSKKAKGVRT